MRMGGRMMDIKMTAEICISYNTPLSALAGIHAQCPRTRST